MISRKNGKVCVQKFTVRKKRKERKRFFFFLQKPIFMRREFGKRNRIQRKKSRFFSSQNPSSNSLSSCCSTILNPKRFFPRSHQTLTRNSVFFFFPPYSSTSLKTPKTLKKAYLQAFDCINRTFFIITMYSNSIPTQVAKSGNPSPLPSPKKNLSISDAHLPLEFDAFRFPSGCVIGGGLFSSCGKFISWFSGGKKK